MTKRLIVCMLMLPCLVFIPAQVALANPIVVPELSLAQKELISVAIIVATIIAIMILIIVTLIIIRVFRKSRKHDQE